MITPADARQPLLGYEAFVRCWVHVRLTNRHLLAEARSAWIDMKSFGEKRWQ
jgi:hypothetical protein